MIVALGCSKQEMFHLHYGALGVLFLLDLDRSINFETGNIKRVLKWISGPWLGVAV